MDMIVAMVGGVGILTAVKFLLFGRGPVFGNGRFHHLELEERIADLEEKNEAILAVLSEYNGHGFAELEERLDFAERMLGQRQFENLEVGEVLTPTPV